MFKVSKVRLVAIKNDAGEVVVKAVGAARWVVAKRSAIVGAVTAVVVLLGTEFPPIADNLTHTQATSLGFLFAVAGWIASVPIIQHGTTSASQDHFPTNSAGALLTPASMSSVYTTDLLKQAGANAVVPAASLRDATTVTGQTVASIETGAGGAAPVPTITDVSPVHVPTQTQDQLDALLLANHEAILAAQAAVTAKAPTPIADQAAAAAGVTA